MIVISKPQEIVLQILGAPRTSEQGYRLLHFCVQTEVQEGVLLYNLLTCELLLLRNDEASSILDMDYLRRNWFVVPVGLDDCEIAEMVRWVMTNTMPKSDHITSYTIFPTTDCNARCFYCYELGRSRIPMSDETAKQVVSYISDHCGGNKVRLTWFGGEPLYNLNAIDIICDGLSANQIEYQSFMVSNAYLFNNEIVKKAVENWHLKSVQITLDGTEKVYNKSKAFIYKNVNPYTTVLDNIDRLLNAGIQVRIRFNVDLHNGEDLVALVKELALRFPHDPKPFVYTHLLFDAEYNGTEETLAPRYEHIRRIEEQIEKSGFSSKAGIKKHLPLNRCMADLDSAVTILPSGDIGVCEHHSEDEFIGHLSSEGKDQKTISSWRERVPAEPECANCFFYPHCIRLKKCSSMTICRPYVREDNMRRVLQQMKNQYNKYRQENN